MPGCIHFDLCLKTFDTIDTDIHRYYIYIPMLYTPGEQVDEFAEAQRTPLPEYVAGIKGDKV